MSAIEDQENLEQATELNTSDAPPQDGPLADDVEAAETDGMTLAEPSDADAQPVTRRKIEEQLEALKRKEVELRRALVMADHPELADSIRVLQGRAYALERVEAKLAVGLSKAEQRRKETLHKQRTGLLDKRAELDAKIAEIDGELDAIGVERQRGYEGERRQCIEELLVALGTHDAALQAAGIEATELVPEIKHWLPEVEALAERLAGDKARSN